MIKGKNGMHITFSCWSLRYASEALQVGTGAGTVPEQVTLSSAGTGFLNIDLIIVSRFINVFSPDKK